MSNHEVPSYFDSVANNTSKALHSGSIPFWEESNLLASNKPVRIHCKAGSVSVRLVFEARGKCKDFNAQYKDDGVPYAINSPFFCCTNTTITVRQSRSIEDREIGKQFTPLWKELAEQLKVLFPDGDDEGVFILPALDARSQIIIKDRKNGIGKPSFQTCSAWKRTNVYSCCTWSVCSWYFTWSVTTCFLKPTKSMCDGRTLVLPRKYSRLFVLLWSLRILIWLPGTSMLQLGAVAVVTISVLLMKPLLIVLCLRRRGPHHCGDLDPFWTIGRMYVVFWSHLVPRNYGKWTNMDHFPFLDKLSVSAHMIKAAIMRRGFICTSLTGVTSGNTRLATLGISAFQNVLRMPGIVLTNETFARNWADHSLSS